MAIELTDAEWFRHAKAAGDKIRYLRENFPSAHNVSLCFVPSMKNSGHIHIMTVGGWRVNTLAGRELTEYFVGPVNGQT